MVGWVRNEGFALKPTHCKDAGFFLVFVGGIGMYARVGERTIDLKSIAARTRIDYYDSTMMIVMMIYSKLLNGGNDVREQTINFNILFFS